MAMASPSPPQPEGIEMKEGRDNARRWWTPMRVLQTQTKRAKVTVMVLKKGKEKAEEVDVVAVIPQLRELKAPKVLKL